MNGSHIIKDNFYRFDQIFADMLEGFDGFGFSGSGVTHQDNSLLSAVFELDVDHGAMNWQPAFFHHCQVVQSESHFLQVTEVFNSWMIGNASYPDAVLFIMVVNCFVSAVFVSENHQKIRTLVGFSHRSKLKQVGHGQSAGGVFRIEINVAEQFSDFDRQTEPFVRINAQIFDRISFSFNKHSFAF